SNFFQPTNSSFSEVAGFRKKNRFSVAVIGRREKITQWDAFVVFIGPAKAIGSSPPLAVPVIIETEYFQETFITTKFRAHSSSDNVHRFKLIFVFSEKFFFRFAVAVNFDQRFYQYNFAVGDFFLHGFNSLNGGFAQVIFYVPAAVHGKRYGSPVISRKPGKKTNFIHRNNKQRIRTVFKIKLCESTAQVFKTVCKMGMSRIQPVRIAKVNQIPYLLNSVFLCSFYPVPDF